MNAPDGKKRLLLSTSGSVAIGTHAAERPTTGTRRVNDSHTLAALEAAVRGAIELSIERGERMSITLRGDPERGIAVSVVEGTVRELRVGADGAERVVIGLSEDADQVVRLERIARILPLK